VKNLKYRLFEAHGGTNFKDDEDIFNEIDQDEVKVILASKVLETSITIEDVGVIVDFGREKLYKYDTKLGVSTSHCQSVSYTILA
jgi:HrpA-like RNA helicase